VPQTALTLERVIAFLQARGLISEQTLVEHDVRVEEIAGRNHNFRVVVTGAPSYFLKQAPPDDMEDPALAVESELYRRVLQDGPWNYLAPCIPRFRLYDADEAVLVTDWDPELRDVVGFDDECAVLSMTPVGEAAARALAACHRAGQSADGDELRFLPRTPPDILSMGRPSPSALRFLSPAQIQVIQVIQERPAIQAAMDRIGAEWTGRSLVHTDVKWSNVLMRVDRDHGGVIGVVLIDWELGRLGDAAWDVGSVFHSYLAHGVLSAPVPDRSTPGEAAEAIGAALSSFHNQLRAFWDTYAREAQPFEPVGGRFLERAIRCCIVRLVQTAYEWSQEETAVSSRAAALLQLALNMLSRTDEARRVVLGGLTEH
jgi:hypothetical protein